MSKFSKAMKGGGGSAFIGPLPGVNLTGGKNNVSEYKLSSITDPLDVFGRRKKAKLEDAKSFLMNVRDQALALQMEQFFTSKGQLQPFIDAGHSAAKMLEANIGTAAPLVQNQRSLAESIVASESKKLGRSGAETNAALGDVRKQFEASEAGGRRYGRAMDAARISLGELGTGAGLSAGRANQAATNFADTLGSLAEGIGTIQQAQTANEAFVAGGAQRMWNNRPSPKPDSKNNPGIVGVDFMIGEYDLG